jgi:hypothetical protein
MGPSLQPQGELEERKRKEMKGKLLSFPFFSFPNLDFSKGYAGKK